MLLEDVEEMTVGAFELGDQVTIFGKHGVFSMGTLQEGERPNADMAIPGMQKAQPCGLG